MCVCVCVCVGRAGMHVCVCMRVDVLHRPRINQLLINFHGVSFRATY